MRCHTKALPLLILVGQVLMTCLQALHNSMCCCTACHDVHYWQHNSKTTHSVELPPTTILHTRCPTTTIFGNMQIPLSPTSSAATRNWSDHLHRFHAPANSTQRLLWLYPTPVSTCAGQAKLQEQALPGCPANRARACGRHQPARV